MQGSRVSARCSNRARCAWRVAVTRLGVKAERCGVVAAAKRRRATGRKRCGPARGINGGAGRCRHLSNRRLVDLLHLVRPHDAFCRLGGGRRGGCSGLASSAALAGRCAAGAAGGRLADAQQRAQHRAGLLRALLLLLVRRRVRRRRRLRLWFRLHARLLLLRRLRLRRCGALLRLRLHARLRQARLHIGITWRNRRRLPERHDGCARAAQRQQRRALRPAMAASALRANRRRDARIRPGSCLAVPAFDVVGAQRGG